MIINSIDSIEALCHNSSRKLNDKLIINDEKKKKKYEILNSKLWQSPKSNKTDKLETKAIPLLQKITQFLIQIIHKSKKKKPKP